MKNKILKKLLFKLEYMRDYSYNENKFDFLNDLCKKLKLIIHNNKIRKGGKKLWMKKNI